MERLLLLSLILELGTWSTFLVPTHAKRSRVKGGKFESLICRPFQCTFGKKRQREETPEKERRKTLFGKSEVGAFFLFAI